MQQGTSCPSRDLGLVGGWVCAAPHGANTFWPGIGGCRGAHFLRSCPGKNDSSGAASSYPQSIHTAGGFVQWGPCSLSSGACEQRAALCTALGHAQANFPGHLAPCLPSPPTHWCAHGCTRAHTQAGHLPLLTLITRQHPGLSLLVLVPVL